MDIKNVRNVTDFIRYFTDHLRWDIDIDDFDDIEDISYDFSASDIGLKEDAFAKITSLRQLQPLVNKQEWGIFCVEFDSKRFEPSALRKILSKLVPRRRLSNDHAVWDLHDLLFICNWGESNDKTIGIAHFEETTKGLPQIKMISCAPQIEDFTQIKVFEEKLSKFTWPTRTSDIDSWRREWASAFSSSLVYGKVIQDSSTLVVSLAAEAQNIRNRILDIFSVETSNGYVHLLFSKFKQTLVHDMTELQFADMYAQTIVYGLFSARCMDATQETFSPEEAVGCIPNTNPFLKKLMEDCFSTKNNALSFDEMEIGNVIDLLVHTRTDSIIQDFNRQTGGGKEDPVIHFYEEFLTAYDKAQKVRRGVFYTPQPIVNFMVRAVDDIVKNEFGYVDGLASTETKKIKIKRRSKTKNSNGVYPEIMDNVEVPAIQLLDPAVGTGTFIRQVILQIYKNFRLKYSGESEQTINNAWNKYVPENLLTRINAFELMMAPYAVAHMKLAMILKDTGYNFTNGRRLNVFLTNSLEKPGSNDEQPTFWSDPLAVEAISANGVKKNKGINIIIGNPPYSGESSNKGEYILSLLEDYKTEPGGVEKLQEKNSKWINDDYVKFIRFGQECISQSVFGIIAYICPHGFLDNPTFRGMRWNLKSHFDKLYIINLHGNTKKKETCPDGGKDENVFDIMQGVCIIFAVKEKKYVSHDAEIFYYDCFGTQERKYRFLSSTDLSNFTFEKLNPSLPMLYFIPKDFSFKNEYEEGFDIQDLFTVKTPGFVTARDALTIAKSKEELKDRLKDFISLPTELAREKYNLGKDVRDWKVEWAQKDIINSCQDGELDDSLFCRVSYRCFDNRISYYTGHTRGFYCMPRKEVMQHLVNQDNLGLVTVNRQPEQSPMSYYFVADCPISNGFIRSDSVSIDTIFPLFSYDNNSVYGELKRITNFNLDIIERIENKLAIKYIDDMDETDSPTHFSPFDLFDFIYGYLYSGQYKSKFREFLKLGYPRIPYPKDKNQFRRLVTLGRNLRNIHLMKDDSEISEKLKEFSFSGSGSFIVESNISSAYRNGKIFINSSQYFPNVPIAVWNSYIGGYQPLQKWLKDRRQSQLSNIEIEHYSYMIAILEKTDEISREIDAVLHR